MGSAFQCMLQVAAFQKWAAWLRCQSAAMHREPLVISLDETSVSRAASLPRGNNVKRKFWPRRNRRDRPRAKSKLADRRSAVSHIALATHHTDVQAAIPHVFVGIKHIFTNTLLTAVAPLKPRNVHLFRENLLGILGVSCAVC